MKKTRVGRKRRTNNSSKSGLCRKQLRPAKAGNMRVSHSPKLSCRTSQRSSCEAESLTKDAHASNVGKLIVVGSLHPRRRRHPQQSSFGRRTILLPRSPDSRSAHPSTGESERRRIDAMDLGSAMEVGPGAVEGPMRITPEVMRFGARLRKQSRLVEGAHERRRANFRILLNGDGPAWPGTTVLGRNRDSTVSRSGTKI